MDLSGHEPGHPQHENAPADLKKNGISEADAKNQHNNLSGDGEGSNASKGRAGKQARLREIANDDKVSSALRGEIKRDINEIKSGKRRNIRVPKGYQLAHRRGYEARKGYGYKYSDLNHNYAYRRIRIGG